MDHLKALSLGIKLEEAKDDTIINKYYQSYVKECALDAQTGVDTLEFFYGRDLYQNPILSFGKAYTYALVADATVKLYRVIKIKSEGSYSSSFLKKVDSSTILTSQMQTLSSLFSLVSSQKQVEMADIRVFDNVLNLLNSSNEIYYDLGSRAANSNLLKVITMLANQRIRYEGNKLK